MRTILIFKLYQDVRRLILSRLLVKQGRSRVGRLYFRKGKDGQGVKRLSYNIKSFGIDIMGGHQRGDKFSIISLFHVFWNEDEFFLKKWFKLTSAYGIFKSKKIIIYHQPAGLTRDDMTVLIAKFKPCISEFDGGKIMCIVFVFPKMEENTCQFWKHIDAFEGGLTIRTHFKYIFT